MTDRSADRRLMPLLLVAAVTAFRIAGLAFDRTDLFVDEAQYWLWGQSFEAGYYSKPPLIAWVIGVVTSLADSDAKFWIRLPGPIFHALTALILAAAAVRLWGEKAGIWTAVVYVTLPFTVVGSAMISTDTILAPFYAGALYAAVRATDGKSVFWAALAGASLGAAFLAKYAAVYFLIGLAIAQIAVPARRLSAAALLSLVLAFLAVAAPNILWNLNHDLTTVGHTMDNAGWIRTGADIGLRAFARLAEFLISQFAVFGPVLFAALLVAVVRGGPPEVRWLICLALPPLVLVAVQAFLSKAYANWGLTAYFPGTLIAVAVLLPRPRLLVASVALHTAIAAALPVLTALAPAPLVGGKPLLARYLGRAALSEAIIATARDTGQGIVVAESRDILADLFHTGRASGLSFRAVPPKGRALNFYQQTLAFGPDEEGEVLAILDHVPACDGVAITAAKRLDTKGTAYAGRDFAAYVIPAACARGL